MILTIIRLDSHPVNGTIGALRINGTPICWTLEPYLYGNTPNRSAIPAQPYLIEPYTSERYGQVWQVANVPGRDSILIHAGNTTQDTEGCILPGFALGELGGLTAVLNSRMALDKISKALEGADSHKLIVKEAF